MAGRTDVKISVIVPVYNVEKELPRCIESLLTQTHSNFELLLINDGSSDGSPEIMERYAEKDPRIWRYTFDGEKMYVQDGRFVFD